MEKEILFIRHLEFTEVLSVEIVIVQNEFCFGVRIGFDRSMLCLEDGLLRMRPILCDRALGAVKRKQQ